MVSNDGIEVAQQELGQKVEKVNILFLDPSSSCTGYTVAEVDFVNKSAVMKKCGAIWFANDWKNQEKYHYVFNAITNYFNIVDQIDYCICEAYMINKNKMMGAQVVVELHGGIQCALSEINVKYNTILPQVWRGELGIKPDVTMDKNGKKVKDFKAPVQRHLEQFMKFPAEIKSNVTGIRRALPNDLTDSLGIAKGTLIKFGIKTFDFSKIKIQDDMGVVNGV